MKDTYFKAMGALANVAGDLVGLSEESKQFYASGYCCPQCHERLLNFLGNLTVNFYSEQNEKIPIWKFGALRAEFVECPKCNYSWKLKGISQPSIPTSKLEILAVIETDRMEENIGTDKRSIDNSKSIGLLKRKFTVSKQWTKTFSIEYENAKSENSAFCIGVDEISVKSSFADSVRKKFSISEESQETYAEQVELDVPAATHLTVYFQWKRIWQCGFIQFRNQNNEEWQVPFRVAVGVTFDQQQVDEA